MQYRIYIEPREDRPFPVVPVTVNGKSTNIPVGEEFVVDEAVVAALNNATEPYPVKINDRETETRYRRRFPYEIREKIGTPETPESKSNKKKDAVPV